MDDKDVELIERLCAAGVQAARHYLTVSGEDIATMPEYFLNCAIFNALAAVNKTAITLETPFWQIHEWVNGKGSMPELSGDSSGWKVDVVIYDGGGKKPSAQKIWGFVELKNRYIDADPKERIEGGGRRTDREKLEGLSKAFPNLKPKLICCGTLNAEGREYHQQKANEKGDRWFEASSGDQLFFGARLLAGSF